MRLYESLKVQTSMQSNGSTWLMLLEGNELQIEQTFNGLFNFGAVGRHAKLDYVTHNKTGEIAATFWCDEAKMRKFFYNRHYFKFDSDTHAKAHAEREMVKLKNSKRRISADFHAKTNQDFLDVGTIAAERPDSDFKDSVLEFAHQDNAA